MQATGSRFQDSCVKEVLFNIYQSGSGGGNDGADPNGAASGSVAETIAQHGMRGPAISDSSLYAGLAKCNLEASEDQQDELMASQHTKVQNSGTNFEDPHKWVSRRISRSSRSSRERVFS